MGSRSMVIGGSALYIAANKIITKGKKLAAHLLETGEDAYGNELVQVHYVGYFPKYREWLGLDSPRLQPFGARTTGKFRFHSRLDRVRTDNLSLGDWVSQDFMAVEWRVQKKKSNHQLKKQLLKNSVIIILKLKNINAYLKEN